MSDMLGESSMNSGALDSSPASRAIFCQSESFRVPLRRSCSWIEASADRMRMVISERLISRENTAVA